MWTTPLRQIQLPARRGGYGLRRQEGLAPLCYLGSLAQCLGPISRAFPELAPLIRELALDDVVPKLPSLEAAQRALDDVRSQGWGPQLSTKTPFTWSAALEQDLGWPKVQRLLCRAWERYSANEIATDSSWEPWQASRLRSLGCKGNRLLSWLTGVPAGPDSTLADATLFVCLRWTLGLPLPSGVLAGNCVCSRGDSTGLGRHEASCKYGGGAASTPQYDNRNFPAHSSRSRGQTFQGRDVVAAARDFAPRSQDDDGCWCRRLPPPPTGVVRRVPRRRDPSEIRLGSPWSSCRLRRTSKG